jgi:acyl-homoserine-lactone acylase
MKLTMTLHGVRKVRTALAVAMAAAFLSGCLPTDYAATIRTTSYGVPHITADSFTGAGYGYGYAFAQNNFCLFAEELVTLHGERAKYFGAAGGYLGQLGTVFGNVDSDFFYKLVLGSDQAARFKAGSSRATRELADGFATGYNRYLSDTGLAKLPVACRGQAWVKPMTEDDAYLRFSQVAMTGSSMGFIAAIGSATPPAAAVAKAAATTSLAKAKAPVLPFDYADSPVMMAMQSLRNHTIGSNGLALGRDATQSGKGLLLGNPHFPWWGALRLNQVHMTVASENYDVMGATLLGVPLPLIGFNDKVAWTHTFSTDNRFTLRYLAIDPSNPTRYLKDGQSIAMKAVPLTVSALLADGTQIPIQRTLYTTEYGPMLKDSSFAWTTGSGYALQDANASNFKLIDQVILNGKSTNVDSLRQALATHNAMPWVNTMAADKAGDALYANYSVAANVTDAQLAACVPPPFQPLMAGTGVVVLAGTTAACDWTGSVPAAGRPWVKRANYTMNSNDSHWWPSLNTYLGGFAKIIATGPNAEAIAQNNRTRTAHAVVRDRLAGTDGQGGYRFTMANLQQRYLVNRFFKAEKWLPGFVSGCLASTTATPAALDACAVLQAWSTYHTPSSQGVVLFDELYAALGELNDASWWSVPFNPADPQETPRGNANLAAAMAKLETLVASTQFDDPIKRRARIQDVQLLQRAEGVLAMPGGRSTLNNWAGVRTEVAPGQFIYTADPSTNAGAYGNSYIQFVTWDSAGPVAEGILSYSQSSDPANTHFSDQTRKYAAGEWVKLPYTEKQIKADPNYTERVLYEQPIIKK